MKDRTTGWIKPLVAIGVVAALSGAAVAETWDGNSGVDLNWSTNTNWLLDTAPSNPTANTITFDNGGSNATAGTTTNILDADWEIGALTYANTTGSTHTTDLNGNKLTVVGDVTVGLNQHGQTTLADFTNGDLQIGATATNTADLFIARRTADGSTATANLDLSGVTNFTANLNLLSIASHNRNNATNGTLTLGSNNTINATEIRVANVFGGPSTSNNPGALHLGATNVINTDDLYIGFKKAANGTVDFDSTGTLNLSGLTGSKTDLFIGLNDVNTASTGNGHADFSGGEVVATLGTVVIGRYAGTTNSGGVNGTLTLGADPDNNVTADSIVLADKQGTGSGTATGRINHNGGLLAVTGNIAEGASGGGTATSTFAGNGDADLTVGGAITIDTFGVGIENQTGKITVTSGPFDATVTTFDVGRRVSGASSTSRVGELDLSAASSVDIDATNLRVGTQTGGTSSSIQGIVTLSATGANVLDAATFTIADSPASGNTSATSTLLLGDDNTINADTWYIARRKSKASVTIAGGGTLNLSGDANAAANLYIGHNDANGTGTISIGELDLTGGTFNATLDAVRIGRHNSGSGGGEGTLIMDAGTVTANSVSLANSDATGSSTNDANTKGTLQIRGGTFTVNGNITEGGGEDHLWVDGGNLNVTGNVDVDDFRVGFNGLTGAADVDGTFTHTNTSAELNIGRREVGVSSGNTTGTLDLAGTSSVNIDVDDVFIGVTFSTPNQGQATGTLTLGGGTNNISAATEIRVGDSDGAGQSSTSSIELNGNTTFDTDLIYVGRRKTDATVAFGGGGGSVTFGSSGDRVDTIRVGYNDTSTGTNADGVLDLSGGTVDAWVGTLALGRHNGPFTSGGSGNGTLTMDAGTFDVTTINVAQAVASNANSTGTVNLMGGTLIIGTIQMASGSGNATANFNWTGGTLAVDTYDLDIALVQNNTDAASIFSPGASVGTSNVNEDYTLTAGSWKIEIDGGAADLVNVSGHLDLSGVNDVLDIDILSAPTAGLYIIATYGSLTGEFNSVLDLASIHPAAYVDYNYLGGNQIAIVAVPTPAAASTGVALLGLVGLRRRRR